MTATRRALLASILWRGIEEDGTALHARIRYRRTTHRAARGASERVRGDPVMAARVARLHYVSGSEAGILRRRKGKGFVYVDASGHIVRDRATLERIRSLVIPPAWTEVWICSKPS